MLIVDRALPFDPFGGRMQRLLSGFATVTRDLTMAPADPADRDRSIAAALARHEPLYIVDNLRLSVRVAARHPRASMVLDIGDEASSLARIQGQSAAEVGGLFAAQRFVESRARALVVRGLGHLGAIAARPMAPPCCLVPDVGAPPTAWEARPRTRPGLTLGLVGTSHLSRRAPPTGWELPELLRLLPASRALVVLDGSGVAHVARRAAELGVANRLELLAPMPSDRLGALFDRVDVCLSTQTANLAGQVRTTGKLVDYLSWGKVVVASRVGTAAAVLPPFLTVDRDDVYGPGYLQAVAQRIERLAELSEEEFLGLQRHNRGLATALFSPEALAPLWLDKMREWRVVPE